MSSESFAAFELYGKLQIHLCAQQPEEFLPVFHEKLVLYSGIVEFQANPGLDGPAH